MTTINLYLKDGAEYHWNGVSKVRESKREVRWTNARNEKRSMAKAFLRTWDTTKE